ncbi:MAG: GMP synthase - glutamine amidotransferase domain protein [halophilic archaeon J07HX64]|jgi:GMP synthase - Glutamine amidotransferase domain|nr:MAG: GMP synthase - glutamine amidotransferase domain protein [halophilic archaeon J07HX64]
MGLRIALLNASYDPVETRRNFRRELDADLVEYHTPSGEIPETVAFDACVVTGSRASVYWEEPWIDDLKSWVTGAIGSGLPALGVCFGHQLLADVVGGTVEDIGDYELGYRTVRRRDGTTLLAGVDEEFTAFTTHSDRVSDLPEDARLLAANDYGVQGFRANNVFGVQFHPEYDTTTAESVTRNYLGNGREVEDERVKQVLAGIDDENYAAACKTKQLFDSFTQYVRQHRDVGQPVSG